MRGHKPVRIGELWKTCTQCEKILPIVEFHINKRSPDSRYSKCKICKNAAAKELYQEKEIIQKDDRTMSSRERHLLSTYGITLAQYEEMLASQNYCCSICNKHKDEFKRNLAVDHNHITGEIRGLLCNYCNHRAVGRHRDGNLLRKIADYVEQGTGLFVPPKRPKRRKRKG